jgi:hypothetical protein
MELEYKIIQSTTPYFANKQNFKRILDEEAHAGWILVEKFDNYKLRFQRDISHRSSDDGRVISPYRVQVGPSNVLTYGAATLLTMIVVYLIFRSVGAF